MSLFSELHEVDGGHKNRWDFSLLMSILCYVENEAKRIARGKLGHEHKDFFCIITVTKRVDVSQRQVHGF